MARGGMEGLWHLGFDAAQGSALELALTLLASLPLPGFVVNQHNPGSPHVFFDANDTFFRVTGIDENSLRGRPVGGYVTIKALDQAVLNASGTVADLFVTGRTGGTVALPSPGGGFSAQVDVMPLDSGTGDTIHHWLVMLDRRVGSGRTEVPFADEQTITRMALEVSPTWLWATNRDHYIVYLSRNFRDATGLDPEHVLGRAHWEVMAGGVGSPGAKAIRQRMAQAQAFHKFVYPFASGKVAGRTFREAGRPVFDGEGNFMGYCGTGQDVTGEQAGGKTTSELEHRLRSVIERLDVGFALFNRDRTLVLSNAAFRDFFPGMGDRLTPGAALRSEHRGLSETSPAGDDFATLVEDPLNTGQPPRQTDYQLADGTWLGCSWTMLTDGGLAIMLRDITEQRQAESAAAQAEARLMDAIENLAGAFVLWDAEDRLVLFNSKAWDLYGEEDDIMVPGRTFEDIIRQSVDNGHINVPEEDRLKWVEERVRHHLETSEVMNRRYSDGRWVRITEHPTHDGGIVGIGVDITELKKREQALEKAKVEAETANKAKTRFLAAASHDLRQPLHAMGLFADSLNKRLSDPEQMQIMANLQRSLDGMRELFDALLDISRLEAAVIEPEPRVIKVGELFEHIETRFTISAEDKGLALTVMPCSCWIETDPGMFERIIANFTSNAIRYTESGRVLVGCRRRGDRVRIMVIDTGPGIPRSQLRDVFREFHQLGNPERDRRQGLGLGLAIAERLARLLKLRIGVESTPGKGSCFYLDLPMAAEPDVETPLPPVPVPPGAASLEGLTIGLIDDDEEVLEAMRTALADMGCTIFAAPAPEDLIELGKTFDVLIADFRLREEMTGTQAIEAIRAATNSETPGIIVTGDTAPERLKEAQASGFRLLHKPVHAANLGAVLRYVLSKKAKPSSDEG